MIFMGRKIKRLNDEEAAFFFEQLGMILEAGIPVADGLEIFTEDSDDEEFKKVSLIITGLMNEDLTLAEAMEKSALFPDYSVKMVKIGVVTGRLEEVLKGLSDYYSKRVALKSEIRSSVSHPLLLLAMMTVVMVVMVVTVIPMFEDIFTQFDESVAALLGESVVYAKNTGLIVMIILIAVLLISLLTAIFMKIPGFGKKLRGFFSSFIITRGLSEDMALSDVVNALSIMAACGISPEQSLELALTITENKRVLKRLSECERMVLEGEYYADALGKSMLIPTVYAHSLKVAYKSGSFETAWSKTAQRLSEKCDKRINTAISFIEPIIIGILAVIIGAVLLAVMLPMTNIMTAVG